VKNIPDSFTPQQAWHKLVSRPALSAETRSITQALHYCLAEALHAPCDVPIAPRSFMDGFAVRSSDLAQIPARLNTAGEILMGEVPSRPLASGETMFIPTGGFLPEGADAVVMQEDTAHEDAKIIVIQKAVLAQENVQLRGEDFKAGSVLFESHHRLRPQDIAALATFGITEVPVTRKPVLAIISTGNELIDFRGEPGPAQIRETNALTLASATEHFGFSVQRLGIIRDELAQQKEAMEKALSMADVVLVSGGSSVGERDYTLEVIRSFSNSTVHFHGLAIRPGNPTIFASIGSKSVFGLPGQPVSSLIVFYHFVLPYLFHLSGEAIDYSLFLQTRFASVRAILDRNLKPLKVKTDYVRVRLEPRHEHWRATPVIGKSASLSTLSQANAFIIVPPREESIEAGEQITAFLFP
jgi:molybdopterin molybdotransferase